MCRTNCLRPSSGLVLNLRVLIVKFSDMAPAGARALDGHRPCQCPGARLA